MKIAIIGAGAAGVIAAIIAKRLNEKLQIDLFEANNQIGKKILASGNGRCNISNSNISFSNYIGENPSFVSYALKQFTFNDFEKFCKSIGLLLDIKDSCKVYPLSNEAKSVTNLLNLTLSSLNINLYLSTSIDFIKKDNDVFSLQTSNNEIKSYDKVLISTGLGAAPQLNANEKGLDFATFFGHKINQTYPSLVGLNTLNTYGGKLQGVKKEVKVSLYVNNNLIQEISGDLLFTKYGVSGFSILDISQLTSYNLTLGNSVEIRVNFFPNINRNELTNQIQTLFKTSSHLKVVDLLTGIISNKIAPVLLDICKIDLNTIASNINTKEIKAIAYQLNSWSLKIIDTQGFSHAEASGGGIKTDEINDKTYESKLVKNLYFAGEILDIVGNRGGFNLHFAWASGYLAGINLAKN